MVERVHKIETLQKQCIDSRENETKKHHASFMENVGVVTAAILLAGLIYTLVTG